MLQSESVNLSPGANLAAEGLLSSLEAQQQHEDKKITQEIQAEKKKREEKEKIEKAEKQPPRKPKKR